MKPRVFLLTLLTILFFSSAIHGECLEGSNWVASWTDAWGNTTYTLTAPCKVYIGESFNITATVTEGNPYCQNDWVGSFWAIIDNTEVIDGCISCQNSIWVVDGQWQRIIERTYEGTPVDHEISFQFTDHGECSGFHGAEGSVVGNTTVDPYPVYTILINTILGSGTVTGTGIDCPPDCSESYPVGTNVDIAANPNTGWYFDHWSGDITGNTNPYTLLMDSDKSVTVTFEENDTDGDGVSDSTDNCPSIANPDQTDTDSDGLGNECDSCPNDADNDADGDGVCGDSDNCPSIANPDQNDIDEDGLGDVCDDDADGDGFINDVDCNDLDPDINPDACDIKGDGIDQDCDGTDRTTGKPCVVDTDEGQKEMACKDGVDNDNDGFVDCEDSDCSKKKYCRQ